MPGKTIGHLLPTRLPWIWRGLHGTMGHSLLMVSILEDGVYPLFTRSSRVCVRFLPGYMILTRLTSVWCPDSVYTPCGIEIITIWRGFLLSGMEGVSQIWSWLPSYILR